MIRFETFSVEIVFEHMDRKARLLPNGARLRSQSPRLMLFRIKGIDCVSCEAKGSFFALEASGKETPHLNLYALTPEGKEILMTKDHIQPKAKGGKNELSNYQPMCVRCNGKKADKVETPLKN